MVLGKMLRTWVKQKEYVKLKSIIAQKMTLFITTAVKTSNST
jgi:hypothetical protein